MDSRDDELLLLKKVLEIAPFKVCYLPLPKITQNMILTLSTFLLGSAVFGKDLKSLEDAAYLPANGINIQSKLTKPITIQTPHITHLTRISGKLR